MAVTTAEIAWLAGILEGEACFMLSDRKVKDRIYKRIYIQLVMTDKDICERVARLFGTNVKDMPWRTEAKSATWRVRADGDRAAGWMMTIFSFMGERRKTKILKCLDAWKKSPGRTRAQRMRLVVAQGGPENR